MSQLTKAIRRIHSRYQSVRELESVSDEALDMLPAYRCGSEYAARWDAADETAPDRAPPPQPSNPLWEYFMRHEEGPGVWKWEHYFPIYQQFFERFVGQKVDVLEIGIFSGGSLDMWPAYFGDGCRVYGVDIEPVCHAYEKDNVKIYIGDQADRSFWHEFKREVSGVDVVIDDGGHTPEQQTVTLEEMLPHLRPGGIYLCEDVLGIHNRFAAFVAGLVGRLNAHAISHDGVMTSAVTPFQQAVYAIHFYPFVVVIERQWTPPAELRSPRRGTQWQPFL